MGCNPSTVSESKQISIVPANEDFKINQISPQLILKKSTRQLSHITRNRRIERDLSTKSSGHRLSSPPLHVNDFWGTMPFAVLVDRLYLFYEEIDKQNGNYPEAISFIRTLLSDLGNDFEHSNYKVLKKGSTKFKNLIGKYSQGVLLMKCLGYREKDDCLELDKNIAEANTKYKIKEFEHAISKVESKTGKIIYTTE